MQDSVNPGLGGEEPTTPGSPGCLPRAAAPVPNWKHVGERLRWLRLNVLRCSGSEFARRAGVSQQRLNGLERHGGAVRLDTLAKIAAAAGRPVEWFWAGPPPENAAPDWLEPELADVLNEMGPERRKALLEVLRRNPNWPVLGELPSSDGVAA